MQSSFSVVFWAPLCMISVWRQSAEVEDTAPWTLCSWIPLWSVHSCCCCLFEPLLQVVGELLGCSQHFSTFSLFMRGSDHLWIWKFTGYMTYPFQSCIYFSLLSVNGACRPIWDVQAAIVLCNSYPSLAEHSLLSSPSQPIGCVPDVFLPSQTLSSFFLLTCSFRGFFLLIIWFCVGPPLVVLRGRSGLRNYSRQCSEDQIEYWESNSG